MRTRKIEWEALPPILLFLHLILLFYHLIFIDHPLSISPHPIYSRYHYFTITVSRHHPSHFVTSPCHIISLHHFTPSPFLESSEMMKEKVIHYSSQLEIQLEISSNHPSFQHLFMNRNDSFHYKTTPAFSRTISS